MPTSKITRWAADPRVPVRLAASLLLTLASVVLMCPAARADGDPASDVLLGQNVFYPYLPPVSGRLQARLNAETGAAAHAHFPIRVALIAGPTDLGVVPELFGKPHVYANFLGQELRLLLGPRDLLLVVMPDGYGVRGLPPAAQALARTLPKPTGSRTNDLAQAAIAAVGRLAAASGHPIGTGQGGAHADSSGGPTPIMVGGLALACIAIASGVLLARRRFSPTR